MIQLFRLLLLFVCLVLLAGCDSSGKADEKAVRDVLQARARALNQRDINLYLPVISQAYSDKGREFGQLKASLQNGFNLYEKIDYQADQETIRIRGNEAEVDGSYRMRVTIRGRQLTLDGKEHLKLAREPGGWRIIAGL